MSTIQFELGGGASIVLPTSTVAEKLIERLTEQSKAIVLPACPKIGEYLPGQGGIYVGDILGNDGVLYGLIDAGKSIGKAKWGKDKEWDLSDWDGLSNTNSLGKDSPAAKIAAEHEADGHVDFYLPSRRELIVAAANVPHLFEKAYHWTSSPYGSNYAWAVDFEHGDVLIRNRTSEFLVRPFRRFIASSL